MTSSIHRYTGVQFAVSFDFFAFRTMAPKKTAVKVAPASGVSAAAPDSPQTVQNEGRLAKIAAGKHTQTQAAPGMPAILVADSPAAADGLGPAASESPGPAASAGPSASQKDEACVKEKKDEETKKRDAKEADQNEDKKSKSDKKDKKGIEEKNDKNDKSDKREKTDNKDKSDKKEQKDKKKQKKRKAEDEAGDNSSEELLTPRIGKREEDTQADSESEVCYMSRVCILGYTKTESVGGEIHLGFGEMVVCARIPVARPAHPA